jgi:hypothetical protein
MLRYVFVAAAAAALLTVGALSAMAGNSHARSASTNATTTMLKGVATNELKSQAAQSNANAASASAQTQVQKQNQDQAETDEDTGEADEDMDDTAEANEEAAAEAPATTAPVVKTEQEGAEQDD